MREAARGGLLLFQQLPGNTAQLAGLPLQLAHELAREQHRDEGE